VEIIHRNLKKAGWSLGWVSAVDSESRTLWIVDAHRDGTRFIVRADDAKTFSQIRAAKSESALVLIELASQSSRY
jgi:hypothetical protein